MRKRSASLAIALAAALIVTPPILAKPERASTSAATTGGKQLTFTDLMKFRDLHDPVIADDGSWIAYQLQPDRGDGEVVARSATNPSTSYRIERGASPAISPDGRIVVATVQTSLADQEAADAEGAKGDDAPKTGLALLDTTSGEIQQWQAIQSFALSDDGAWLAMHEAKSDEDEDEGDDESTAEEASAKELSEGEEGQPLLEGQPTGGQASTVVEEMSAESEMQTSESTEAGAKPSASEGEATEEPIEGEEGQPALEASEGASTENAASSEADEADEKEPEEHLGTTLRVRQTIGEAEREIEHVAAYAFDATSRYLAYAIAQPGGDNGLFVIDLNGPLEARATAIAPESRGRYSHLTWTREHAGAPALAFVAAQDDIDQDDASAKEAAKPKPGDGALWIWSAESASAVVETADLDAEWRIPSINDLAWSRDGQRLFFGTAPRRDDETDREQDGKQEAPEAGEEEAEKEFDAYDIEALLEDTGVDVWHVKDPLIKTNARSSWEEGDKDRTYRAVYHRDAGRFVQLADEQMRAAEVADNPRAVLARADTPYLRERTWEGFLADLYWVSLEDGSRKAVVERSQDVAGHARLSPDGRWVVYFEAPHWFLFDADEHSTRNLTQSITESSGVRFDDEDHDYPRPSTSYQVADWYDDSSAVLIYDKFDIWHFPTDGTAPRNLTASQGRKEMTSFRIVDTDPDEPFIAPDAELLVNGYRDLKKNDSLWRLDVNSGRLTPLLEEPKRFGFVAKAKDADRLLYTRESYREFPNLWIADPNFEQRTQLTDANPQVSEFAWGHAELVSWNDADGVPLQGVLIRPEVLKDGERCPVLVYFYRFFSQRLHQWNQAKVNHRPNFPLYASDGYCIFLPDVRFEVGRPGISAVRALVPGVQKLIDMGVADPQALGLHGHSWSGYQAAFMVTQTDIFAAAVLGAPVSNMTSAYSGIRWGSGLARQFQYEQSQSRIGKSLFEARDLYIENSPVFYADRIETPLVIQFGDEDEAVPWTQGIELYLALRRLNKEAVMLEYHGEGHHLKKYPNKLDYAIKMKEFFDHYLKGEPAPAWWSEGVAYEGE